MKVVILGGGISGLLAGWVFREHRPVILEAGSSVGGAFASGGLKYVRYTEAFVGLLDTLDIEHSIYTPMGGLLLPQAKKLECLGDVVNKMEHPTVVPHPEWMRVTASRSLRTFIQEQHWRRTRGSLAGFKNTCMNDPMGEGGAAALRFDFKVFTERVSKSITDAGGSIYTSAKAEAIQDMRVITAKTWHQYDLLVTTLPLGVMGRLAPHLNLPTGQFQWLTIGIFNGGLPALLQGLGAEQYDYIYTPWLPLIHRISRDVESADTWEAEASGRISPDALQSVLGSGRSAPETPLAQRTLGWEGRQPMTWQNIPGHLLPLDREPEWPVTIVPLGRFAEWDIRSTAEKTLARALALKDRL